jgi:hypothetical protein
MNAEKTVSKHFLEGHDCAVTVPPVSPSATMKDAFRTISFVLSFLILVAAGSLEGFGQSFQWSNITPESGPQPEARRYGTAIYDPVDRRVIIFGGLGASGFLNDVWSFDVVRRSWSRIATSGSAPAPRFGHNAVYDKVGRQMVVWAGQQGGQFYNDTWTLDFQSLTWRNVSPSARPKARYGSASVFDPNTQSLVQFAGFTEESVRYQDTQAFNLPTSTWTDITPSGTLPEVRCLLTAALDRTGRRMIIFGGQHSGPLGDFWSFDLQARTWAALNTTRGPAARFFSTSFVDTDGSFILFGGTTATGNVNDTWRFRFDTSQWAQLVTRTAPSPRSGMMGAYLESEGRFIIFGGSGDDLLNDVWELSHETAPPSTNVALSTKTAIVIVNPGVQEANVTFFFTDSEGQDLARGIATIPSNSQIAQFLSEAPFNGPPSFQGTFTIQSALPVAVAVLRGVVNPGGEFAGASLPAADLSAPAQDSAMLPLVTDGGGWSTQIVLINPTDQVLSGSIQFQAQNQASTIEGSALAYVIPARSARTIQRVGVADTPQTYPARVTPIAGQMAPAVFAIVSFRRESVSGTHTVFTSTTPSTAFRIYVENQ